jgi:hypothetical protein
VLAAVVVGAIVFSVTFALASGGGGSHPPRPSSGQLASDLAPQTSASQSAILADGVVTRDEYEAAVNATVNCLAAQGFTVSTPMDKGDGFLHFEFVTADKSLGASYQAAYQSCLSANEKDVDVVWAETLREQKTPPPADAVAASRAAIAQCLGDQGVKDVDPTASLLDMIAAADKAGKPKETFYQCVGIVQSQLGVIPEE